MNLDSTEKNLGPKTHSKVELFHIKTPTKLQSGPTTPKALANP